MLFERIVARCGAVRSLSSSSAVRLHTPQQSVTPSLTPPGFVRSLYRRLFRATETYAAVCARRPLGDIHTELDAAHQQMVNHHTLAPLLTQIQAQLHEDALAIQNKVKQRTEKDVSSADDKLVFESKSAHFLSQLLPLLRSSFRAESGAVGARLGDALLAAKWIDRYSRSWPHGAPSEYTVKSNGLSLHVRVAYEGVNRRSNGDSEPGFWVEYTLAVDTTDSAPTNHGSVQYFPHSTPPPPNSLGAILADVAASNVDPPAKVPEQPASSSPYTREQLLGMLKFPPGVSNPISVSNPVPVFQLPLTAALDAPAVEEVEESETTAEKSLMLPRYQVSSISLSTAIPGTGVTKRPLLGLAHKLLSATPLKEARRVSSTSPWLSIELCVTVHDTETKSNIDLRTPILMTKASSGAEQTFPSSLRRLIRDRGEPEISEADLKTEPPESSRAVLGAGSEHWRDNWTKQREKDDASRWVSIAAQASDSEPFQPADSHRSESNHETVPRVIPSPAGYASGLKWRRPADPVPSSTDTKP